MASIPVNVSGESSDSFSTPLLDAETPKILKSISEQGGYAFVAMSTLAASSGDLHAAEAARDMAWEQLHSGPWHSVVPVWRDAYSMACLHVARFHYRSGEFEEAIRVLDMGMIMGGLVLKKDLDSVIQKASVKASGLIVDGSDNKPQNQIINGQFNVAEVVQILPKKSLSCKIVGKKSDLSLEGFLRDYFLKASPIVLTDCMAHWPARTKWNDLDYLKKVAGCRTVPVEVGKNYLSTKWKQELITFSEFLERIHQQTNNHNNNHDNNDCISSNVPTYLAQHPLFDQIEELRKDIMIPDYCFTGDGEIKALNAWFGPAGTVTPLHHDPHHNILAQVVGKKYIRLYPSSISEELYPHTESMLSNSSRVDLDNVDEDEFPKVKDLEFIDCILEEGEMLYIPPKWWHYVRSLTASFSVSFWWS